MTSVSRAGRAEGRLQVLAVTNMYPTDSDPAYGVFVASQMESVARAGVDVSIEFIDGRRSKARYLTAIARVRRLAGGGQFDLVHAHFGLTGFVCAFQSTPLVVSFCGDDLLGASNGRGGATITSLPMVWMSRFAAHRANAIICKSDALVRALPATVDRSLVTVIGNGVDTEVFCPGDKAAARRELGMDQNERLILFPHDVRQPVKRYDLARAAIDQLQARGKAARLWVVNGVPHRRLPVYYRAADCMLLTSDHEGSPNTVKEGLCCDLPLVAVDVGDVKKLVSLAPNSLVVGREPSAIADGLDALLERGKREDGKAVRAEFGLPSVAARVVRVYEAALARRRIGSSLSASA